MKVVINQRECVRDTCVSFENRLREVEIKVFNLGNYTCRRNVRERVKNETRARNSGQRQIRVRDQDGAGSRRIREHDGLPHANGAEALKKSG